MFTVDLNEQTNVIEIKNNDENNSTNIAEGHFAVDVPDRTVLVIFNHITVAPDDYQQIDQILSVVISHLGNLYKSLICIRFPVMFDHRIELDKLEFKNEISDFMLVTMNHLKYYPENTLQEQYELITDKEIILNYAEQLLVLMKREAFWTKQWDLKEMRERINSATTNAMILDKTNDHLCGFGRLFVLTANDNKFGYISDIAVNSSYQSKGLGRIIVNYFVGTFLHQDVNGTLCLRCAKEGSGAVSATKLYKRSNFKFTNEIGNLISIFTTEEKYARTSE